MKTLVILFILLTSFREESCLQMDLILVGDLSGSVQGYERFVSDAFATIIESNEIDENFQIGIVTFNDWASVVSKLSPNKDQLMRGALSIKTRRATGNTHLLPALKYSLDQLRDNGVITHKKMIILITDGAIDDNYESSLMIAQLKQLGIMFCGVLVKDGSSNSAFFKASCDECYVESSYENLVNEIKKLNICI